MRNGQITGCGEFRTSIFSGAETRISVGEKVGDKNLLQNYYTVMRIPDSVAYC